ncbi:MAG: ferredoxin [bacterium]
MENNKQCTRREFLRTWLRTIVVSVFGYICYLLVGRKNFKQGIMAMQRSELLTSDQMVWQIDSSLCVQCGQCATHCMLAPSAVKCVHLFSLCGYCKLCFAYFRPGITLLTSGAENQLCPTGAISRRFVEDPYYEYMIDEALCIGCGKCVKGCTSFGNGSLCLQIRHDLCVNCNECAIARACPSKAIRRVPAKEVSLLQGVERRG